MSTEIKKEEVIEKKQSTKIESQEPKSKKKKSLGDDKLEKVSGGILGAITVIAVT